VLVSFVRILQFWVPWIVVAIVLNIICSLQTSHRVISKLSVISTGAHIHSPGTSCSLFYPATNIRSYSRISAHWITHLLSLQQSAYVNLWIMLSCFSYILRAQKWPTHTLWELYRIKYVVFWKFQQVNFSVCHRICMSVRNVLRCLENTFCRRWCTSDGQQVRFRTS